MDGILALAADREVLLNKTYDDERRQSEKKTNVDDDASHHQDRRHQSEKKQKHNDGGSNNNRGKEMKNRKEDLQTVTVVMKVDFHCRGCRRRIFDAARSIRGVETVKIEEEKNKMTIVGRVDPAKLHEKLETTLKKKIDLISPQPKKKDRKNDDDQSHNMKKQQPKEPPLTTFVLKMSLHCDGCRRRIRQIVRKTEGVHSVEMDREKELVTVRGAVDPKAVQMRLKLKMKRSVEIVPAKKDKEKANGEKMEQHYNGGQKQQQQQKCQKMCCCCNGNGSGGGADALLNYYGYVPAAGYVVERLHAPQIFSDENPNACAVM